MGTNERIGLSDRGSGIVFSVLVRTNEDKDIYKRKRQLRIQKVASLKEQERKGVINKLVIWWISKWVFTRNSVYTKVNQLMNGMHDWYARVNIQTKHALCHLWIMWMHQKQKWSKGIDIYIYMHQTIRKTFLKCPKHNNSDSVQDERREDGLYGLYSIDYKMMQVWGWVARWNRKLRSYLTDCRHWERGVESSELNKKYYIVAKCQSSKYIPSGFDKWGKKSIVVLKWSEMFRMCSKVQLMKIYWRRGSKWSKISIDTLCSWVSPIWWQRRRMKEEMAIFVIEDTKHK